MLKTKINNERKITRNMNATLTAPQPQRITLYYREGSSDKVYQAAIEPQGELFVVNFAYGRRGSTMNTGTKTQTPGGLRHGQPGSTTKLVSEKKAKGYTEGPDGTPYQNTPKEDRVTGLLPQLLNPIDEQEVKRLLKDPAWAMQEKLDGRRVLVRKTGAGNPRHQSQGAVDWVCRHRSCVSASTSIPGDFIMDGECVGDLFHAFDLLEWDGEDCRTRPYQCRLVMLSNLLNRPDLTHISWVETATDPANKERLFRHLQAERKEGVVFKRLDAPYTPGRPNSGGNQLKHKFYATCSAVVAKMQ